MSKKKLNLGTWNLCNGLCNKVSVVRQLLYQADLDILFLQEIEIPKNYNLSLLIVDGYEIEVSVAANKSRIVAYIKSDVRYRRTMEDEDTNVILLNLDSMYDVEQLAGMYRPFKMVACTNRLSNFKLQIKQITDFVDTGKRMIVCGDFNLDYSKIDISNYAQRRLYDEWLETTIAFDLVQMVRDVTWTRVCKRRCLIMCIQM